MSRSIDFSTVGYWVARYGTSQILTNPANAIVKFPTLDSELGEGLEYLDGVFTVKRAGVYYISTEIGGSLHVAQTTEIWKNNQEFISNRSWGGDDYYNYVHVSTSMMLEVGDTFTIRVSTSGPTGTVEMNSRARCNMNACLLLPIR